MQKIKNLSDSGAQGKVTGAQRGDFMELLFSFWVCLMFSCWLGSSVSLSTTITQSRGSAAELSTIRANLTEHLQESNTKLVSVIEERDQLKANLTEMTEELKRLQSLSKQKDCRGLTFLKEFCQLLGEIVRICSDYHPQSNGQIERLNQELETCLQRLISHNQATWSDYLTWVEYTHNTLPSAARGLSPFQRVSQWLPASPVPGQRKGGHKVFSHCHWIWASTRQVLLLRELGLDERQRTNTDDQLPPMRPGQLPPTGQGRECAHHQRLHHHLPLHVH
ncbi:hypothetical protein L3Q82_017297, partial [Scortum barcoo]